MATWPSTLPAPQRVISVQAGSNIISLPLLSGRTENRRFGSAYPDRPTVQFKLFNVSIAEFENFFDRDANLGVNWFSASWLSTLGYTDHKAKIIGYPRRKAQMETYSIYSVTLLVKASTDCPDDTEWPSAGPGEGP